MTEDRESTEKARQSYAALGFGFVCVVIGLPLWWKTTEVYRVQLPYGDIDNLHQHKVQCRVEFTVLLFDNSLSKVDVAEFGETLRSQMQHNLDTKKLSVQYFGNIRHATEEQLDIYKSASSQNGFDSSLSENLSTQDHGHFYVALLPVDSKLHKDNDNAWIGKHRIAYLKKSADIVTSSAILVKMAKTILINEAALDKVAEKATTMRKIQKSKDSMRAFRYNPGYEVTFTLLNPQPNQVNARWDIEKATNDYLQPMLDSFEEFTKISVKSQYLFYTNLYIRPHPSSDKSSYYLHPSDLPHIITPVESHLASHVSNNAHMNFILYIPTRDQSPLYIHTPQGDISDPNAFFSPRWGGVQVYNVPPTPANETLPIDVDVNMRDVMNTFASQLRMLLGVDAMGQMEDVSVSQPGIKGVSDWELDRWLRVRTLENTFTSVATLKSLIQLLGEVGNIVINDDIGLQVEIAVSAIKQSHKYLQQGKLRDAFLQSKQAIYASETAFFDPSLLELLYFPEDQKFAIYIPLFLPISIPVLMSLYKAFLWFTGKDKKQTDVDKKN